VVGVVVPSFVFRRWLRRLHSKSSSYPVSEELRGWCWSSPPVRPRAYLGLSVSDVASYCSTRRDVWLRRVRRVRPQEVGALRLGSDVHEVISRVAGAVRTYAVLGNFWECNPGIVDGILEDFRGREWFDVLREVGYITYYTLMSDYVWSVHGQGLQPFLGWLSEVRVDGSPIGLSPNLRVDAIVSGNLVIDFKVGRRYESHDLALTAYAMALEANLEVPVDYGFIVYITPNGTSKVSVKGLYIDSDLRRDLIDSRDEVIDMLLSEREPPKALSCPQTCPYRQYCGGGG